MAETGGACLFAEASRFGFQYAELILGEWTLILLEHMRKKIYKVIFAAKNYNFFRYKKG